MSLEIAWKQNILVTDSNLLKSLLVVFGFGSQAFLCEFSRQNICSVHWNSNLVLIYWEAMLSFIEWFVNGWNCWLLSYDCTTVHQKENRWAWLTCSVGWEFLDLALKQFPSVYNATLHTGSFPQHLKTFACQLCTSAAETALLLDMPSESVGENFAHFI